MNGFLLLLVLNVIPFISAANAATLTHFPHVDNGHIAVLHQLIKQEIEHQRHQSLALETKDLDPSYLHLLNKTMDSFIRNITDMSMALDWESQRIHEGGRWDDEIVESEATVTNSFHTISSQQYDQSTLIPSLKLPCTFRGRNETCSHEISRVVNEVRGSREKARVLALEAIEAFQTFKNQYKQHSLEAEDEIRKEIVELVDREAENRALVAGERLQQVIAPNRAKIQPKLLNAETWNEAGMTVVKPSLSGDDARKVIDSITLESFRLRDDMKKDVVIANYNNRVESKTRKHIGVRNWTTNLIEPSLLDDSTNVDSTTVFYFNLAALSSIASSVEKMEEQKSTLDGILKGPNNPSKSVETMLTKVNSSETFETLSDLAFRTAALETESLVKNMVKMVGEVKHWLKIDLLKFKSEKKIQLMQEQFHSQGRIAHNRDVLKRKTIHEGIEVVAVFSSIVEVMGGAKQILGEANATARGMALIVNRANSETTEEILRINAGAEEERNQEHFSLEKIKAVGEEARKSIRIIIEALFAHIIRAAKYVLSESDGRRQALLFASYSTILLFAICLGKESTELLASAIKKRLSMPRLVREWGQGQSLPIEQTVHKMCKDIVLGRRGQQQLLDLCYVFEVGRCRSSPLRNILVVGKAGTGKSLTAKAIAEASGLPYAIISGSDIAPLGKLGPSELRRILTWAETRRRGGILIIDDSESALGKRLRTSNSSSATGEREDKARSEQSAARDALNVFLSMTGETGGKIMLILTTSKPSALDEAVLDRCDEIIHCSLPSKRERQKIISLELEKRLEQRKAKATNNLLFCCFLPSSREICIDKDFAVSNAVDHLSSSAMTHGFSGRELASIIRAVVTAIYGSDECLLTKELWNKAVDEMRHSITAKKMLKE